MSRVFFAAELEAVATFWRIFRRDGVTLGFISHDRDLVFDGLCHRAAPGMLPSAIRRTADFYPDSAEITGALSHAAVDARDLADGRFDDARVEVGVVDWETLERATLYNGTIGAVRQDAGTFLAELRSAKAALDVDPVPRTSPTCRARFCGPGCNLSPARFTRRAALTLIDRANNRVAFAGTVPENLRDGHLRWIDGPHAGLSMQIVSADADGFIVDRPLDAGLAVGTAAILREGCDHTLATCIARFGNGTNFRGEPFLPGNDILARYPTPR